MKRRRINDRKEAAKTSEAGSAGLENTITYGCRLQDSICLKERRTGRSRGPGNVEREAQGLTTEGSGTERVEVNGLSGRPHAPTTQPLGT